MYETMTEAPTLEALQRAGGIVDLYSLDRPGLGFQKFRDARFVNLVRSTVVM